MCECRPKYYYIRSPVMSLLYVDQTKPVPLPSSSTFLCTILPEWGVRGGVPHGDTPHGSYSITTQRGQHVHVSESEKLFDFEANAKAIVIKRESI